MIVGVPGAPIGDPDFQNLRLIGTAITVLGFEDMIFKRRAAFTLAALPEGLKTGGSLSFEVIAPNRRRDEAVFDLQQLMRRASLKDFSGENLLDFMRVQAGREAAGLQGVLSMASHLAYREAVGLDATTYMDDLVARTAPPPEEIRKVAGKYLKPDNWVVVSVGPPSR